jgi:hypothetical protein
MWCRVHALSTGNPWAEYGSAWLQPRFSSSLVTRVGHTEVRSNEPSIHQVTWLRILGP